MKTEWQTCLWCITREISPVEFVIKCHSLLLCPLRLEKNRVIGHENGSASLILMAPFINQANHTRDTYKADFTLSFIFRRHRTLKRRIRFRDRNQCQDYFKTAVQSIQMTHQKSFNSLAVLSKYHGDTPQISRNSSALGRLYKVEQTKEGSQITPFSRKFSTLFLQLPNDKQCCQG